MLIQEPEDTQVAVGDSAYFNYTYTGFSDNPVWYINKIIYYRSGYPLRHSYSGEDQVLKVVDSQLSDNGSTYQCALLRLLSRIATLTVYTPTTVQSESNKNVCVNLKYSTFYYSIIRRYYFKSLCSYTCR